MALVLLFGRGSAHAEEKLQPKDIVQWLFKNADALDQLSFAEIAQAASGQPVLPIDTASAEDKALLAHISKAAASILVTLNAPDSPVKGLRRINEASKFVEDLLVKKLNSGDFSCQFPLNAKGAVQRSGYPDLEILQKSSGRVTYLDPKLFEVTARSSTLRTFYFEPKEHTLKIAKPARHLLLGIAHDGKDGDWTLLSYDVVDLSKLKVRLKAEFDASNKEVYVPAATLLQEKIPANKNQP